MVVIILITLLILILIYNFYSNINNNELYENIQSEECYVELINISNSAGLYNRLKRKSNVQMVDENNSPSQPLQLY